MEYYIISYFDIQININYVFIYFSFSSLNNKIAIFSIIKIHMI